MLRFLLSLCLLLTGLVAQPSQAALPPRVVALDFAFTEDLLALGIMPVGVADDGRPQQVLTTGKPRHWQSVGSRAQPDIERIAALHPDLILADRERHSLISDQLERIAPTLMLPSRRASYSQSLEVARQIANTLNLHSRMQQRLHAHQQFMDKVRTHLSACADKQVLFIVTRGRTIFAHAADSYIGELLARLGLKPMDTGFSDAQPSRQISIEQLLALNPPRILAGRYGREAISTIWRTDQLWHALDAVKKDQVDAVDGPTWVRGHGILSAERIAKDLDSLFGDCQ